jgi:thiamine transporter ThiT
MRRNNTVYTLAVIGLMTAVMAIFAFTPVGSIFQAAGFSITLLGIPLAIMACLFGPWMGAIGGFIWGTFAIIQAFTGQDFIGTLILGSTDMSAGVKYGGLILMCYSRVLVGFLAGLINDALRRVDKKGYWSSYVAALSVGVFNTVFFMALFCLFFFKSPTIQNLCAQYNLNPSNAFLFSLGFVGIVNIPVEWSTDLIIGGAAAFGIEVASRKMHVESPFPRFFAKKEPALATAGESNNIVESEESVENEEK